MDPTAANLSAVVGMPFSLDGKLSARAPNVSNGAMVKQYGCIIKEVGGTVSIQLADPGKGVWIPYAEGQAVVGYASGGQSWVASGPFSGCEFAVGSAGGRVFGAHIARQSGSSAKADYKAYRDGNSLSEWYWNQIPMPSVTSFSCSYVFAKVGGGGILSMTRMDVNVTSMGGSNGTISNVHKFK